MSFSNTLVKEGNGFRYGRMIHAWLFKKDDLVADSPSRRDGISYEDELLKRQQGGVFIYEIVNQLTHGKGEHGLSGVAATLFNRFFKFHSFKRCDYRDVAAACVFLAGKNEDSPKKLKYVVNQLWQFKFPHNKTFPSEQHFMDQCQVVSFLEEVILRTISFDVNIDLPHQYVLKLMQHVERGRNVYKEMVKTAYYMATEVLIITDWSIRYSAATIATACVNIAAYFHNIKMDDIVPPESANWFKFQDDSLTREELELVTKEFIDIYARSPYFHIGSLKKLDPHGKVKIVGRSPSHVSSSSAMPSSASSNNLKKIDMEAYKERQKATVTSTDSTRQSFLPDVKNQKVVEQGLMEQKKNHHHHHRHQNHQNGHTHHQQNGRTNGHHQMEQPHQKAQKRSGAPDDTVRAKKTRIDYQMNFVAASSTTTTTNGFKDRDHVISEISAYAIEVSKINSSSAAPPQKQPPSDYQKMCMEYENNRRLSSSDSRPQRISPPETSPLISSMHHILPPPPQPPILYPRHVDEIEEGELR